MRELSNLSCIDFVILRFTSHKPKTPYSTIASNLFLKTIFKCNFFSKALLIEIDAFDELQDALAVKMVE